MKPVANSILVMAAHPDDEVLGCGGTLARLVREGAKAHVAFLTDGIGARLAPAESDQAALDGRRQASLRALARLGITSVSFDSLPDNRMDTIALLDIVKHVEVLIARHRPDTLFTHHAGDVNIDHRRLFEAVTAATRPQAGQPVRTLLSFEVPSSTEWQLPAGGPPFLPNWFTDISSTLELKLQALEDYAVEMRPWPHPRSLEGVRALARWRGATIGVEAAEAFMLGRCIQ